MKFLEESILNGHPAKKFRSGDFIVEIAHNDYDDIDISTKYEPANKDIPAFWIPSISYFHGSFACDLSIPASTCPSIPHETLKVRKGIELVENVVADIQAYLAKEHV